MAVLAGVGVLVSGGTHGTDPVTTASDDSRPEGLESTSSTTDVRCDAQLDDTKSAADLDAD